MSTIRILNMKELNISMKEKINPTETPHEYFLRIYKLNPNFSRSWMSWYLKIDTLVIHSWIEKARPF